MHCNLCCLIWLLFSMKVINFHDDLNEHISHMKFLHFLDRFNLSSCDNHYLITQKIYKDGIGFFLNNSLWNIQLKWMKEWSHDFNLRSEVIVLILTKSTMKINDFNNLIYILTLLMSTHVWQIMLFWFKLYESC